MCMMQPPCYYKTSYLIRGRRITTVNQLISAPQQISPTSTDTMAAKWNKCPMLDARSDLVYNRRNIFIRYLRKFSISLFKIKINIVRDF